jgi:glycosyltransferase involved in cell wall biosynthesis
MKRVLMLCYYFAPRNHIASMRPGCFAKFLPENGWLPTVICDEGPRDGPDYNPGIIGALPADVTVHRISASQLKTPTQRLSRKLGPYFWPASDPYDWCRKAALKAAEVLKGQRFDAIWATSDPLVPLGVAAQAAHSAGLPLVADIRDSFNVQRFGSWYKRPIQAFAERRLCSRAAAVITVSDGLAKGLSSILRRRVDVINNGYDPTLLPERPPVASDKFRLLYAGNIMLPQRSPTPLLEGAKLCIERNQIPRAEFEVVFLGSNPDLVWRSLPPGGESLPVRILPKVPHNQALIEQMKAAALLSLTHHGERGVLTGKIFDYLAAGRPILAVPDDEDEISALLTATNAGVSRTTPEQIADTLATWYAAWRVSSDFTIPRNESAIASYSRREQARSLASILLRTVSATAR